MMGMATYVTWKYYNVSCDLCNPITSTFANIFETPMEMNGDRCPIHGKEKMAQCFFGFVRVLVCVLMFYAFADILKDGGEIIVACVLLDLCS